MISYKLCVMIDTADFFYLTYKEPTIKNKQINLKMQNVKVKSKKGFIELLILFIRDIQLFTWEKI